MAGVAIARWSELADRQPTYALVGEVDLVVVRFDHDVAVLYGRCLHRGALLSDGFVSGRNLICGAASLPPAPSGCPRGGLRIRIERREPREIPRCDRA